MATTPEIPDEAICHICGKPMQVIHHEGRAAALGFQVPEGQIISIECCDYQLNIDDDEVKREVVTMLEAYHALVGSGAGPDQSEKASSPARAQSTV